MAEQSKVEKGKEIEKLTPKRMVAPFEEMDRMFESVFPRGWPSLFRREWPRWSDLPPVFEGKLPEVDVIDRDSEIVVRAAVPGVEKKDLDVSVTNDSVTIKGESKHEEKEEKGDYYRCEISRGAFARTVMLPAHVDSAKVKASFKDGVLELVMPKIEKSQRRSVKID